MTADEFSDRIEQALAASEVFLTARDAHGVLIVSWRGMSILHSPIARVVVAPGRPLPPPGPAGKGITPAGPPDAATAVSGPR